MTSTSPSEALYEGEVLGAGDSKYVIGLDTFDANVTDTFDRQVYVKIGDGIDAATATSALEETLEQWPNAELQDQASFKEAITAEIDMMLNLIYGLLALAVIIALIGIANTLALSVHERTRELGLLRAVGMTRHQLRTAIRWESVLISLFGTALGLRPRGRWRLGHHQGAGRRGRVHLRPPQRAADGDRRTGRAGRRARRPRSRPPGRPPERAGGDRHAVTSPAPDPSWVGPASRRDRPTSASRAVLPGHSPEARPIRCRRSAGRASMAAMAERHALFVLHDAGGTVPPVLAIAQQLVARGDAVTILSQASVRDRAEAAGCRFVQARVPDYDRDIEIEQQLTVAVPAIAGAELGEDVLATARGDDVDIVVVDPNLAGALAAAESLSRPSVVLLHSLYATFVDEWFGALWPVLADPINTTRAQFGREPCDSWASLFDDHDMIVRPSQRPSTSRRLERCRPSSSRSASSCRPPRQRRRPSSSQRARHRPSSSV